MEINWSQLYLIQSQGKLYEYMLENQSILEFNFHGSTMLHFACRFNNTVKEIVYLIQCGLNINEIFEYDKNTPLKNAIEECQCYNVKILLAVGAKTKSALDYTLLRSSYGYNMNNIIETLLSNLVKLSNVNNSNKYLIEPWMEEFETGVELCRDVIVILLGLKKRNNIPCLRKLDRFLIKQVLAVEIWTTRTQESW